MTTRGLLVVPAPTEVPALTSLVSGVVRPALLVSEEHSDELRVFHVRFDPGARNHRHTHSFDQVLFVTDGQCVVATDDEEVLLGLGDLVVVPAGQPHWHGAPPTRSGAHLAVGIPGTSEFDGETITLME